MTTRALPRGSFTLPRPGEKQHGGLQPGTGEYPIQRRAAAPERGRAEMMRGQTAELGFLIRELARELDAASLSRYPDIHLFLVLNLTDALIRRAVLLRSAMIARQTRVKHLLLAQGAEQAEGAQE